MSSQAVDLSPHTKTFSCEAVVFLIEPTDGSECTADTKDHLLLSIKCGLEEAAYLRDTLLPSMTTDDEKEGWSKCVTALIREQPMAVPSPSGGVLRFPVLGEYTYRHTALDKSKFDSLIRDGPHERVVITSTDQGAFDPEVKRLIHSLARIMSTEAFERHLWPELLHDYPQEMRWFQNTIEKSKVLDLAVMALSAVALSEIMNERESDG
ncbi:hypothetical protein JCM24511_01308 [Saitozyma sp. JCM 24511]|nr:hypothetical protein JCM24511_01308 [Saitozyma sp. JCM 24511]